MLCERKKAECYQFSHLPLELLSEHSFTKRGEQIELALKLSIGVGFPLPVISPANAAVGVRTMPTTTAVAAMTFLMLAFPSVCARRTARRTER